MEELGNLFIFVGRVQGEKSLGSPRLGQEDISQTDLGGTRNNFLDRIHLSYAAFCENHDATCVP
jgi:hypothetical protein